MKILRDSETKQCVVGMSLLLLIHIVMNSAGWHMIASILCVVMWGICVLYLIRRDHIYEKCAEIVEQFEEGDFSTHLPKNREGNFFALLSRVDRLAMTLKSRNESEIESRKLINDRISDISHQLKTPLSALLMYNEIIEQEPENPEVVQAFNDKSKEALGRMQQLIQLLLVMTRLDSGCLVFEKEKYYAGELIREAVRKLMIRAQKEGKEILFEGNEEEMIVCDKKWTMEAISNIVKNALDHTERKGRIQINWKAQAGVIRVSIKDNGTGIRSEEICHIFKRFYRGKDNKENGIGLGLPLAKAIIEEQGGTILLDSIWGEGTTMIISLIQEKS